MNNKIIRYGLTVVAVVIAFLMFSNRNTESFSYRAELKSLKVETEYVTDLFVTGYNDILDGIVDNTQVIETQKESFDSLISRYETIEMLPSDSNDDYSELLLVLEEQLMIMDDIVTSIKDSATVPGEYKLALKKIVEQRILYEGRMGRY